MLSLLTTLALAGVPTGPPSPPKKLTWAAVDRRSIAAFDVAATGAAVGLGLTFVGLTLHSPEVTVAGLILETPGTTAMAATSLRSARAIRGQGGVAPVLGGYATWALWGAGVGMWIRAEVEARTVAPDDNVVALSRLAGGGLHLACFATAGMQGFANLNARRTLPPSTLHLGVLPTTSPPGLTLILR